MENKNSINTIQDIKSIMERSSKFLSLSGLSGVFAGISALIGGGIAIKIIQSDTTPYVENRLQRTSNWLSQTDVKLLSVAILTLIVALIGAFYFTYKKSRKQQYKIWNSTSKRMLIALFTPLIAGGFVCLYLWTKGYYELLAPMSLIFYGVSLLNASKYTLPEIKWLGNIQIIIGLINLLFVGYGIYFWMIGFGLFHIIYGIAMWNKYDRAIKN